MLIVSYSYSPIESPLNDHWTMVYWFMDGDIPNDPQVMTNIAIEAMAQLK